MGAILEILDPTKNAGDYTLFCPQNPLHTLLDCNISDDILASIDLLSIHPSCPTSNERVSSVMENVASYGTFNNCSINFVMNSK